MLSSIVTRRLLKQAMSQGRLMHPQRSFSLLVPLQQKAELPFELRDYDKTNQEMQELEKSFEAFNQGAQEELKEMN